LVVQDGFTDIGRSAGATTAITISHIFRDEGVLPALTGLFLACPAPCVVSSLPEKYQAKRNHGSRIKIHQFSIEKLVCFSQVRCPFTSLYILSKASEPD